MYWEGYLTIMQLLLQVGLVLAFLTRTWIIFFRCIILAWKSRVHFTENMIVRIVIACKGILSTDDVLGDISLYSYSKNRFLCCVHTLMIFIICKTDIIHAKMEKEPLTNGRLRKIQNTERPLQSVVDRFFNDLYYVCLNSK